MSATIEVVSQIEGKSTAKVLFDAKVRLLRVGIDEVSRLGIAEGLEGKWQEGRRLQVALINENLIRKDSAARARRGARKALLVLREIESGSCCRIESSCAWIIRGRYSDRQSLKNRNGIQVPG